MNRNNKRLFIRLPCYILDDFKKLCVSQNRNISSYIRDLISLEIIKHGKDK